MGFFLFKGNKQSNRLPLKARFCDIRVMQNGILKYLDMEERMEIAKSCGITTRYQVYKVATGKSKNFRLLKKLVERAEENRRLIDRINALDRPLTTGPKSKTPKKSKVRNSKARRRPRPKR